MTCEVETEKVDEYEQGVRDLERMTNSLTHELRPLVNDPEFRKKITKIHEAYHNLSGLECEIGAVETSPEYAKRHSNVSNSPAIQVAEAIYQKFYKE